MTIEDVQVIITKETAAVTQAGFGMPLIVGHTGGLSEDYKNAGYVICRSLSEVAAIVPYDEGTGGPSDPDEPGVIATEVYKIAQAIFGQTPAPEKVAVVWIDMSDQNSINTGLNKVVADGHNDWYFLVSDTQTKVAVDTLAAFAAASEFQSTHP